MESLRGEPGTSVSVRVMTPGEGARFVVRLPLAETAHLESLEDHARIHRGKHRSRLPHDEP